MTFFSHFMLVKTTPLLDVKETAFSRSEWHLLQSLTSLTWFKLVSFGSYQWSTTCCTCNILQDNNFIVLILVNALIDNIILFLVLKIDCMHLKVFRTTLNNLFLQKVQRFKRIVQFLFRLDFFKIFANLKSLLFLLVLINF